MIRRATQTQNARIEPSRRAPTQALRDLEPNRPVMGGDFTYNNSFSCLPDLVPTAPDVRTGTWILDGAPPR
jgi:hypothetical protein